MTRTLRTGQSLSTRRHAEDFRWVAEAAAAAADESVARVTAVLEETRAWPRASLIVTSSCGTGLGDRGVVGAACGVDLGQVAVPLVWYLPGAEPARSPFPAQLSDLASTLTLALDPTDPREGWGLFSGAPHDRTRTSLAWFTRAGRPQAAYRLTTDALTLLVDSAGEATLFDRGWDRGEYTDLSARQAPLVRRQRTELVRRLWGTAPQLWILVKGGADDLVSGVVRGRGLAPAPPVGLEPLDAVKESEGRLAFSLVADEADVLKIALPAEFESLVVEIQSPRSRTPVVLGPKAAEWSLRPIAMGPFAPAALQAFAGTQPPDPVRWLAERPATLAVWLVGSEAGSGP